MKKESYELLLNAAMIESISETCVEYNGHNTCDHACPFYVGDDCLFYKDWKEPYNWHTDFDRYVTNYIDNVG